jgi:hypothetical protein
MGRQAIHVCDTSRQVMYIVGKACVCCPLQEDVLKYLITVKLGGVI